MLKAPSMRMLAGFLAAFALIGCASQASAWPASPGLHGGGGGSGHGSALSLIATPTTQTVTRVGAGSVSTSITYTASGGKPGYTYATSAPSLTVTNGTTTAPTFSKTLTSGQDTTYPVTATVTDRLGNTSQASASIEFKSTVPVTPPVALTLTPTSQLVTRVGAGSISVGVTYTASGGTGPYTYATSAPGLDISGGTTTTPTLSATLTAGQHSTYTVTGTVTDSLSATAQASGSLDFTATAPPPPGLALVITPLTQLVTRSAAGSIAADIAYTASGGTPPYTYSTSAPGLTVTGGTTTTPNVSTTLTTGQDTTYTVTGTVNDSVGSTPAVTSASVEFHAIPLPLALAIAPTSQVQTRAGAGAISAGIAYTASGGVPPYTYATSAPGLAVTGATTTAPSFSTTLTAGQDTPFTVTGTLTDSIGSTPATRPPVSNSSRSPTR